MPSISKRAYGDGWSDSGGARWAFFGVFIVLVIIVVIGTLRVNKRRSRQGIQPIYGTRWLTPPSYRQSERVYNNRNDLDVPTNYVPTYSEQAGDTDMGYYDNEGNFHPNPNAKSPIPEVHVRSTSLSEGVPLTTIPNINNNNNNNNNNNDDDDDDNFYRRAPATTIIVNDDGQSSPRNNNSSGQRYSSMPDGVTTSNDLGPPAGPPAGPPPPQNGPPPLFDESSAGNINDDIRPDRR